MAKKPKINKGLKQSAKVFPRLRMVANGSNEVNAIRATSNQCIALTDNKTDVDRVKQIADDFTHQISLAESSNGLLALGQSVKGRTISQALKKKSLENDRPNLVETNVFLELRSGSSWKQVLSEVYPGKRDKYISRRVRNVRHRDNQVKATMIIDDIGKFSENENVVAIEGSQSIQIPEPVRLCVPEIDPPKSRFTRVMSSSQPDLSDIQTSSTDVIIGIIDVGGFDFAHPDFRNANGTRFLAIWDQGGVNRPKPSEAVDDNQKTIQDYKEFTYGSLITQRHMNRAIQIAKNINVPVHNIEQQSQRSPSSHATHVASIAAGGSGVCPRADIIGVLVSLPDEDEDRTKTFTDSSRISDAVDFLLAMAALEKKPISINISLGTNGHAHDGSSAVNRWIDSELTTEGRCLCVAAGNAGQERGRDENDIGFIMGRIHTSGRITNRGLSVDLEWQVVGNGLVDVSENELEIWYEPQDRFSVMVKPPNLPWIGPVSPQQVIENQQLSDLSFLSVYNLIYHPANGNNYIGIYISPNINSQQIVGVRSGIWKVRLIGDEIRDGHFDAWIERDNLIKRGRSFWNFPSFFTERTNVDNKSINSLACGHNVIAVGNYDIENDSINITSSQGPTRDGRKKPEIVAPGTNIVAANGFAGEDSLWTSKSGTSMASPYVCGVAGLLLANHPTLTTSQISGILKRTCTPVTGENYDWKNDTGFGIIDIEACLEEAANFINHQDITS